MFSLANPNMCVCVNLCVCEYPDIVLRALRTETVVNIAMMHSRNPGAKDCVTIHNRVTFYRSKQSCEFNA